MKPHYFSIFLDSLIQKAHKNSVPPLTLRITNTDLTTLAAFLR